VEYEWDETKAAANFTKHGISFTAAARALEDPRKIEIIDDRFDYGEEKGSQPLHRSRNSPVRCDRDVRRKYLSHHKCPEGNTT
jgi:hypothetical protein